MSMPPAENIEAAAEDTIMTDVLGGHAKVRILITLIGEADQDLNATEIARLAGIDRSTFYEHIDDLLGYGLVEQTRQVGNSQMYRINQDSAAAEHLAKMEWELFEVLAEAEEEGRLDDENQPLPQE